MFIVEGCRLLAAAAADLPSLPNMADMVVQKIGTY